MTNTEAIEIIRDGMEIKRHPKDLTLTVAEVEEAKQMAIAALEQEPCEDAEHHEYETFCNHKCEKCVDNECPIRVEDAVSREAVRKVISVLYGRDLTEIIYEIDLLPSVTVRQTQEADAE